MKYLSFYLPKDYKEQLHKIARGKGVPYCKLLEDFIYQNILRPQCANGAVSVDDLLYIVLQEEKIIHRLLSVLTQNEILSIDTPKIYKDSTYKKRNYKHDLVLPIETINKVKQLATNAGMSTSQFMYRELTKIYPDKKGR